jgi:hypothetical protein
LPINVENLTRRKKRAKQTTCSAIPVSLFSRKEKERGSNRNKGHKDPKDENSAYQNAWYNDDNE